MQSSDKAKVAEIGPDLYRVTPSNDSLAWADRIGDPEDEDDGPTFHCPHCNSHIALDGTPEAQARFEHEGERHD